ncbi:MAG: iron-sulfur cluster repair di-iron protein [Thermoleophilia bacterium]
MQISGESRVADIAREIPASLKVFERYSVDFCCGGDKSLVEAVRGKGLSVGDLISEIERAAEAERQEDEVHADWSKYSPTGLLAHIEETHHDYLRRELPEVGAKLAKVIQVHGDNHHELFDLGRSFEQLRNNLLAHLELEEDRIFPAIRAAFPGEDYKPSGQVNGSLVGWLEDLETDHDAVGQLLHRMREITNGYSVPQDACATYSGLYRALIELEADIHRHVHLENNILLPALRESLTPLQKDGTER